ncbi:MAG: carbon-nitrogen hydrolase family protein [Candidatus Latescibacteria bacterium]|nr:carbon-nitrogen hydrolase family protein [Candidatus Latescibacterota bacterium]
MKLKVAGAQIAVTGDINSNVAAITRGLAYAEGECADILITPEGSLSGYSPEFDRTEAESALEHITALAAKKRIGLALGTCYFENDDHCYNQVRFYGPDGQYLGFHSKTLTCGTMTAVPQGEINDYAVTPLRTYQFEGCTVGALICNDMWANPACTPQDDSHLAHQLSDMGTQVLFHAVNGGRDGTEWAGLIWQFHESNLRIRARAGNLWVVTVDSAEPVNLPCSAPSGVINPEGAWACRVPDQGEQFFAHSIEIP